MYICMSIYVYIFLYLHLEPINTTMANTVDDRNIKSAYGGFEGGSAKFGSLRQYKWTK